MPLPRLFQQGSNNTSLRNIGDAFGKFISEREQLAGQASAWLISNGARTLAWFKKQRVLEWLKQPRESNPAPNLHIVGTTTTDKIRRRLENDLGSSNHFRVCGRPPVWCWLWRSGYWRRSVFSFFHSSVLRVLL